MADKPTDTSMVVIDLILDSSTKSGKMTDCKGTIYFVGPNVPPQVFSGWVTEKLGTPKSGGADFVLMVTDTSYVPNANQTSVANWIVAFLPIGAANNIPGSPFGSKNSIDGSGASMLGTDFVLDLKGAKIQKRAAKYSWNWTAAIQIQSADGQTTICYVSDPQMDVDQLKLSDEQLAQLRQIIERRNKKAAAKAKQPTPAKKKPVRKGR